MMSASARVVSLILGGAICLTLSAPVTAQRGGQVRGQVVDENGDAVAGITIAFTAESGKREPKTATANKKGRFFKRGFVNGAYWIALVDSELFISQLRFSIENKDGLTLGEGEIPGDPRDGVTGVPLSEANDVKLELVVAPKGSEAARERELAVAFPALSAAADLYNQGSYEQATDEAQRILSEHPDLGEAFYVYGLALEKTGRHREAEAELLRATERIPDYPRIWAVLGELSMRVGAERHGSGNTDEAKAAYARAAASLTRAVENNPESLSLMISLAASLDRAGAHEQLRSVLEQILERDATNLQIRLRLASIYTRQDRHEEAMALLQEIPATEKRSAVTIYNIAVGLSDDGNMAGSLLAARRAAQIDPELAHPRRLIAQILLGQDDRPAAIQAIREYLEVAPDDPEAETYRRILAQIEGP